jgi:hypothetical protein
VCLAQGGEELRLELPLFFGVGGGRRVRVVECSPPPGDLLEVQNYKERSDSEVE